MHYIHNTKFSKGENDKYKHCVISCKIAKHCGTAPAAAAGWGKEMIDLFTPGDADWDDIVADHKGIRCAKRIEESEAANRRDKVCRPEVTCEDCCRGVPN
jgi:hypothetical protein